MSELGDLIVTIPAQAAGEAHSEPFASERVPRGAVRRRCRAGRSLREAAAIVSAGLTAAGCVARRAAESLVLGREYVRAPDLAFGGDARQRLDVYRPRGASSPRPVLIFLHGGRWTSGSKDDYRVLADALTRRGWVVVVPNSRVYPDVTFPAWVTDAAEAVRWAAAHIARFGGDPSRLFVVGHSSGGHTAALLALDARYLRDAGVPAGAVRGVVSLAGPVDTVWTDPDVQALMGPREGWPATYPATHVGGAALPLLLLHGASDRTVSASNSVDLAERIRARGGCARAIVYRGVGHIEIVLAVAVPWLGRPQVQDDLAAFVRDPESATCA